ncbi:hypothetical protein BDD12DRAFT_848441 [Trichophaea hybrida]|nr:hypothetical protein BDD12DRAFT_848441 [Trichophaea hybrida]
MGTVKILPVFPPTHSCCFFTDQWKANCRFLHPAAKTIKIRITCREEKDEWTAYAIGYTHDIPGSNSEDLYTAMQCPMQHSTPLPMDAWVLTSATIGFPDPRLNEFYESPAKDAKEINLRAAVVWALFVKSEELVLKEMRRLDVSLPFLHTKLGDWI